MDLSALACLLIVKAVVYIARAVPKLHAVSPLLSRVSVTCRRPRFITYSLHLDGRTNHVRLYPPQKQSPVSDPCRSVLSVSRVVLLLLLLFRFGLPTNHIRFKVPPLSPFTFHGRLVRTTSATPEETFAAIFVVLAWLPITVIPRPAQATQKRLGCRPLPVQHVVAHDQSIS